VDPVAHEPWPDPDAFIREVTDRIWVERDIAFIRDNYEPDSVVHGALGTIVGRDGVVRGTLMRIAGAPRRVGQAEDVVWEARGEDAFLSSHLVLSVDPDRFSRGFVPLRSHTVAACLYRRGRMVEEWVVRDRLADCLQQGIDPDEVAARLRFVGYAGSMGEDPPVDPLAEGVSGVRPDHLRPECELVLGLIAEVWNERRLDRVHRYLPRDVVLRSVGDQVLVRPDGYQRELLRMFAPFPEATVDVLDVQAHESSRHGGVRVGVVWTLRGRYDGAAAFGPLTGNPVQLLGASQFLLQDGRVVREVRVYDEVALRAQINGGRAAEPAPSTDIY
jgi:predicted ester cyclase